MNMVRRWHAKWLYSIQIAALLWKYGALLRRIRKANAPSAEKDFAVLRMCCHVLDKGLNIRPFEPGHSRPIHRRARALCDAIRTQHGDPFRDDAAWEWCMRILREYEDAQNKGEAAAAEMREERGGGSCGAAGASPAIPMAAADWIRQVMAQRVSCRDLADREIPSEIWRRIVCSAVESPTSCCRQAVRFRILHDPERVREARQAIAGATGYSKGIPYLVCVTADLRMYECCQDSFLPIIDASLALDAFSLAAICEGISVTILNYLRATLRDDARIRTLFAVPEHEQIIVFASAGHPAAWPRKPVRRSVDTFLREIP